MPANRGGRPNARWPLTTDGVRIYDEQKKFLCEAIEEDGYAYAHRKLTVELREEHDPMINENKVPNLQGIGHSSPAAEGQGSPSQTASASSHCYGIQSTMEDGH